MTTTPLLLLTSLLAYYDDYDSYYDQQTPLQTTPLQHNNQSKCKVFALHEYAGIFSMKDVHAVKEKFLKKVHADYSNTNRTISVYYIDKLMQKTDTNETQFVFINDTIYYNNLSFSEQDMKLLTTAASVVGVGAVVAGSKLILPTIGVAGAIAGAFLFEEYLYDFVPTTDVGGSLSCSSAMIFVILAAFFGCVCAIVYFEVGILALQFSTGAAIASRIYVSSLGDENELVDHYFPYYVTVILAGLFTVGALIDHHDKSKIMITSFFGGNLIALSVACLNMMNGNEMSPSVYLGLVGLLVVAGFVVQPMMPDLLEDPMDDVLPGPDGGPSKRTLKKFTQSMRKKGNAMV